MSAQTNFLVLFLLLFSIDASAFRIEINGETGSLGEQVLSRECGSPSEQSFTSDSTGSTYSNEVVANGEKSIRLSISEGHKGFGLLGGVIDFSQCSIAGAHALAKGSEVWVTTKLWFPADFEFNANGRNKFPRLRTHHMEGDKKISEGYNDLYLDAPPGTELWKGYAPFQYIFEGRQSWFRMNEGEEFFLKERWNTVEYYLKFDNTKQSEGGDPVMRVWVNGNLIGETREKENMLREDSFVESLYFFTYWDNEGAHRSQHFFADDIVVTNEKPDQLDQFGNPYLGLHLDQSSKPNPPTLRIQAE